MLKYYNQQILKDIANDYDSMVSLLEKWVNINSHSDNLIGLTEMMAALKQAFAPLGGIMEEIPLPSRRIINRKGEALLLPLGKALHIQKHPDAPFKLFFGGHMDTVFSISHPFQKAAKLGKDRLNGPGAADMKGGLVILRETLKALENSPCQGKIGWEVLINPDEELGSPGSSPLFEKFAKRNDFGLIFEPAFPDGALAGPRKGSANYTLLSKGRSVHAGRDFFEGRNAIAALSHIVNEITELSNQERGITVNVGILEGGEAPNIVPDHAFCRFNIRAWNPEDFTEIKSHIESIIRQWNQKEGHDLTLYEDTGAPPKPLDKKMVSLFEMLSTCGQALGLTLKAVPSGGVCDGSRLYAWGLPNIDTLGVVGGGLHTSEEYAVLPSLMERSQLAVLFVFMLYENWQK